MPLLRCFRLRRVQRWPEDGMRGVQVIFSQALRSSSHLSSLLTSAQPAMLHTPAIHRFSSLLAPGTAFHVSLYKGADNY